LGEFGGADRVAGAGCPSRESFESFATGDAFRDARRRHRLPDPTAVRDYPVHALFVAGVDRSPIAPV
jgi:hypothetical protein